MSTAVPLSQMVDLALGTPELGAVNFNVLHTLLHAMIAKLNIQDEKADINEHDREFLQKSHSSDEKYRVGSGVLSDKDSARGDDSILDDSVLSEPSSAHILKTPATDTGSGRPSSGAGRTSSATTRCSNPATPYHRLEARVFDLEKRLEELNALPSTKQLVARVSGKVDTDDAINPVAEMWKGMQLKKKVDANEDGIAKLMLMIEDLMKETALLKTSNAALKRKLDNLDLDDLNKRLKALETLSDELRKQLDRFLTEIQDKLSRLPTDFDEFVRWQQLEDAILGIRAAIDEIQHSKEPTRVVIEQAMQTEPKAESRPSSVSSRGPSAELLEVLEQLGTLSSDHGNLRSRVEALEEDMKNKLDKSALDGLNLSEDILQQLNKLKNDIHALQTAVSKLDELSRADADADLRNQFAELLQRVKEDSDALSRMQKMLLQLEKVSQELTKTMQGLLDDSIAKKKQIEALFALSEELEQKKADKTYVAMEVDVKADKRQLEGKVNHTVFDHTTNELNKAIKDILDKLANNDFDWKDMLAKLAADLEGKLDRLELQPLKDWLEAKLKALQRRIQDGQLHWNEDEAAGLRRQLIQRFHCLSCDKPVDIMPTGPVPSLPGGNAMPASRSPRPYTTFELDQIRQHARSFGTPEQADFYATTRQCGGSHTLTHSHKRLTRMGNLNHLFSEDDAGDPMPKYKEEVDVLGADGHIYKGRMEAARLEAKLPTHFHTSSNRQNNAVQGQQGTPRVNQRPLSARRRSPTPTNQNRPGSPHTIQRPASARASPRSVTPQHRPTSRQQGSRPQSARISTSQPDQRSGNTTPLTSDEVKEEPGEITVEVLVPEVD